MLTLLKWLILIALVSVLLVFAVSNRHIISFSLYPLPYTAEFAAYFFVIAFFVLGYAVAWLTGVLKHWTDSTKLRQSTRRVHALENEVSGLKNSLPQ